MAVKEISAYQKFLALSTDEKPIEGVNAGAPLRETDTCLDYFFEGEIWVLKNIKKKTYEWLNQVIEGGSSFNQRIHTADFDLATAFLSSTGNVQLSFRVASPSGDDYAWDPLGTINAPSMRVSCQAQIRGIPTITVVATNNGTEPVTADIYVYLGKQN